MMALIKQLIIACIFTPSLFAGFWGFEDARSSHLGTWWEESLQDYRQDSYAEAVQEILQDFESATGKELVPGEKAKAALKVYTQSGKGLSTPPELVRAVIEALEQRGFERKQLQIIDTRRDNLREAGYLPPLSAFRAEDTFHGVPVVALDHLEDWHPDWFYENPLPAQFTTALGREILGSPRQKADVETRKSFLPYTLLHEVDFFINLPMVTDHRALGVNGAIANATLWAVSNRDRFFHSPANAPIAAAEIAAVPELLSNWACTILSLERYQFIGGPSFNALYTRSERKLLLSVDPVILDAMMRRRIDEARIEEGFHPLGENLPLLQYAQSLKVGRAYDSR